ncbi:MULTISPECIES: alkaline shock response membrane anchor protein AmaP [unclassified Streptomyces]|uniref:alkaline shock response membrane anchor protein AmaP n=1 Tax=unclassified Streptomyces TaxID=2593676 RepID=UPI001CC0A8F1|nr:MULTISPECIES: alkaline shock response membrane anchor protein AmaP [unclassified Streptomyces]WPO74602.1 alkaline shock response membrane anchor protein AmaP [Streptomyces sp. KN37]
MSAMLRTVNRVLLALTGLVLLVAGGSVLAIGLGASPPSWWLHEGRHDVLVSAADRARWRDEGWFWPTVIAVLALLVLLSLWWLSAQLRRRRLAEVLVATGDGEGALLRGRAMEDVLAGEAETLDGVERAQAALRGRRTTPRARVDLALAPDASPSDALHRFSSEVLTHARDSAGLASLPATVRLRGVRHRAERVS